MRRGRLSRSPAMVLATKMAMAIAATCSAITPRRARRLQALRTTTRTSMARWTTIA